MGFGTACASRACTQGDWVLIDAGDVIVHLFRAEVRSYYDLEGMWSVGDTAPNRKSPNASARPLKVHASHDRGCRPFA